MFGFKHGRLGSAGNRTIIQRAISSLRARGSDAHLWLPGVGTLNGLTTGNYLESTGNTLATVDNPCGLVLDALGTVGSELVTNGDGTSTTGWLDGTGVISVSGGEFVNTGTVAPYPEVFYDVSAVVGATYRIRIKVKRGTSANNAGWLMKRKNGSGNLTPIYSTASTSYVQYEAFVVAQDDQLRLSQVQDAGTGDTETVLFDGVSIKLVSGIHAQQGTTADKGILRLTGGRYNWVFDSTDKLSATIPAGWESATTIDAKSTGQVTLQSQNIVGTYLIGPSLTTYGRIVLKTAPTASELALLQSFANKLAGL